MSTQTAANVADDNEALILYQGDIVRFGRDPRNFGEMLGASIKVGGDSPICGDHMTLYLDLQGARVRGAMFTSSACCAVCKASASMMTDALHDKSLIEVHLLRRAFRRMLEQGDAAPHDKEVLGPLVVFERLGRVPSRVECAVLPWTTLETALASKLALEPQTAKVVALRPHN
jgi:nitrogen fixation NifU-like protein